MELSQARLHDAMRHGLAWCALLVATCAAAADPPLRIGLFPYLPTRPLIAQYEPIRLHLAERLNRLVQTSTAPSYEEFLRRCLRKEYDVVVIGPGMGRFVEKESDYVPLVVTKRAVKAVVLVPAQSKALRIVDLRGSRIATLEPLTMIAQMGRQLLRNGGLDPEHDVKLSTYSTPDSAARSITLGDADAAIVPATLIPKIAGALRSDLRVLTESRNQTGLVILGLRDAHPPLPPDLAEVLVAFTESKSGAGRLFVEQATHGGFRLSTSADQRDMNQFVPEIRRLLRR